MNVGEKIKRIRKKNNMTQQELADAIGKSKSTIEKYEANKVKNFSFETLTKISKALNIPTSELTMERHLTYSQNFLKDLINKKGINLETLEEKTDIPIYQLEALYNNTGYATLGTYLRLYRYYNMPDDEILKVIISDSKTNSLYNNNGVYEDFNILKNFFTNEIDLYNKTIEDVICGFTEELLIKLSNQDTLNEIIEKFPQCLFARYISNLEYNLQIEQTHKELKKVLHDKLEDFMNNYPMDAIFEISDFIDFIRYKHSKNKNR